MSFLTLFLIFLVAFFILISYSLYRMALALVFRRVKAFLISKLPVNGFLQKFGFKSFLRVFSPKVLKLFRWGTLFFTLRSLLLFAVTLLSCSLVSQIISPFAGIIVLVLVCIFYLVLWNMGITIDTLLDLFLKNNKPSLEGEADSAQVNSNVYNSYDKSGESPVIGSKSKLSIEESLLGELDSYEDSCKFDQGSSIFSKYGAFWKLREIGKQRQELERLNERIRDFYERVRTDWKGAPNISIDDYKHLSLQEFDNLPSEVKIALARSSMTISWKEASLDDIELFHELFKSFHEQSFMGILILEEDPVFNALFKEYLNLLFTTDISPEVAKHLMNKLLSGFLVNKFYPEYVAFLVLDLQKDVETPIAQDWTVETFLRLLNYLTFCSSEKDFYFFFDNEIYQKYYARIADKTLSPEEKEKLLQDGVSSDSNQKENLLNSDDLPDDSFGDVF